MHLKSVSLAMAAASLATLLTGCESSTDEQTAQAQSCMDKATTGSQAATCMAMVAGRVDAQANQINCSALFLEWGFTTSKFTTIIETISNNSNGQNAALNILASLPLVGNNPVSGTSATIDVQNISSACQASQSAGLTMLSQFLVMSTTVASLGATFTNGTMDISSAKSVLNLLTSNSAGAVAIGNAAVTIYASYCQNGTSTSSTCSAINKAVGGNVTAGSIAVALGQFLQTQ